MAQSLTDKQLRQLKRSLLARRGELERQIASTDNEGLEHSMRDMLGELSLVDNHPGDIGSELFERGKDIALNENAEHNLEEVMIALENMETGTYGVCVACGEPIPLPRLEAIPWTAYCIKHVPDPDLSFRRPAEERFLQPPFGRTSLDKEDDESEFDGEDAWQSVEKYGNSNSPAMAEDPNDFDYSNPYIESDENDGYVEPFESFVATDLYGNARYIVRNHEYEKYMDSEEGDHILEVMPPSKDDSSLP